MYFILIRSLNPKNSLHHDIFNFLNTIDEVITHKPNLTISEITEKIEELNEKNPRCSPAEVSEWKSNLTIRATGYEAQILFYPVKREDHK